ncbi:HelD family protein [Actinacidiphila glaucinigra]|uniref:HelD family protein n=1 Tax=Actinacidiphila glaucinigra TaxID=235986 RepID=UPI0037CCA331
MAKRARRTAVLAAEQAAVDHAYRCLDRAQQEAAALKEVSAAASGKDAIDVNRAWELELVSLDPGNKALVFMRADVEEGYGRETFYIGRRAVFDSGRNPAVISWTAPAAVKWRLTTESAPGDVRLLRQIICDRNVVKRYFDLYGDDALSADHGVPRDTGTGAPVPGPAGESSGVGIDGVEPPATPHETEWRDPLLDELDRARDGVMHDIVETIQREQLRLVTEEPSGVLVIQGGPGTGKTAVGMHRVTWLLDNEHRAVDEVLVIGPNRGFLDYVGVALSELGTRGVTMLELPALWSATAAPRDPREIAALKSDARMSSVLRRAVDSHAGTSTERLGALVGGPVFTFELRRREVVVPVDEIADLALEALDGDGPYHVRRERCIQRVVQHLTHAYIGLLPGPADTDYFPEIRRLRPVTRLLRRICPELSARDVLGGLFGSRSVMAVAAEGLLTPDEQQLLLAHHETVPRPRAAREPSREDLICLDELDYVLSGRPAHVYGHLVIDEAQDVTPMEARSLARHCPGGSMTILGDLAQATGPHLYADWEELGSVLAGQHGWRIAELRTGFRVPGEVMEYVRRLGRHCAPVVTIPDSVRRLGMEVVVRPGAEPARRAADVARDVAATAEAENLGRTIAVIVPEVGDWKDGVLEQLNDVPAAVLTAGEAKGLEFDHVIVVEPAAMAGDDAVGLRHLYIALTRCTQSLTVVHERPLPHWIDQLSTHLPALEEPLKYVARRDIPTDVSVRSVAGHTDQPQTRQEREPMAATGSEEVSPIEAESSAVRRLDALVADRVRASRRDRAHEALRHRLLADLYETFVDAGDSDHVDAWCLSADGMTLFEVLGGDGHTYDQIRQAALTLLEAASVHPTGQAEYLVAVLREPPAEPWITEAVSRAFSVILAWWEGGAWRGPGARHITGVLPGDDEAAS